MTKIVFEDDAAWAVHLAETREEAGRDALEAFKAYFCDEDGNMLLNLDEWGGEKFWDEAAEGALEDVANSRFI